MAPADRTLERPRRPRDRRAQIADAAAARFRDLGYHRVGIEEIAGAVGITGRAIYRHFDTKQDLLTHVVFDGVERLEQACADGASLTEVIAALASVAVERRHVGVLLQRETRNLAAPEQAETYRRLDAVSEHIAGLVGATRPELSTDEATFLARCALAVLASPSHHNVALQSPAAEALLVGMTEAALRASVREGEPQVRSETPVERASRRESVLAAAIELFGRRGFGAVRMEDVGAAAGMKGPSIYEHFDGKADLLMAALTRGAEWLQLGLAGALVSGEAPADALARVVRSYVGFTLEHTDLMRVFLREAINLPDAERAVLRRVQHAYVAEWVRLLAAARPDLTDSEAWLVTHGGLSVINDTVERNQRHDLVGVSLAVLLGESGR